MPRFNGNALGTTAHVSGCVTSLFATRCRKVERRWNISTCETPMLTDGIRVATKRQEQTSTVAMAVRAESTRRLVRRVLHVQSAALARMTFGFATVLVLSGCGDPLAPPSTPLLRKTAVEEAQTMRTSGTVKWFNDAGGNRVLISGDGGLDGKMSGTGSGAGKPGR
jgi:hypothetical protein